MPAIQVSDLQKIFQSKRKAPGLSGSMRALVRPEYVSVEAVRRLSFQMEAGELLGFIGPNGAGKSTTIKMLTGILLPSDGQAQVLGYTPWKPTHPGNSVESWPITLGRFSDSVRSFGITCRLSIPLHCSEKSMR